jgi:hypothetical protein
VELELHVARQSQFPSQPIYALRDGGRIIEQNDDGHKEAGSSFCGSQARIAHLITEGVAVGFVAQDSVLIASQMP